MKPKGIQKKVRDDYNTIAKEFSETRQTLWKDFDFFTPYLKRDFSVLDLGCGNGRLLGFLKENGVEGYIGLDQSVELLKEAKKNWPGKKFLEADMSSPLPTKKKFDALFVIAAFHHLPPQDHEKTLRMWKEHLKPGGFLFMINWNLHQVRFLPLFLRSLLFPNYGFRGVLVPWKDSVRRYYFAFTRARLARLFKRSGYSVLFNDYTNEGKSATLFTGKNILTIAQNGLDGRSH
jgi:SAM-dependent methyltransferase